MGKVMINQGTTFSLPFRVAGAGILMVIVVKIMQYLPETIAIPIAILLCFLVPILWFSSTILTISTETNKIHLGNWVMGFKTGKPKPFNSIEKFYVNKVNVSQTMNTRANSYTSNQVEYQAFLKLDDGEKYFLVSHRSEKKLEEKVAEIKKKLGIN